VACQSVKNPPASMALASQTITESAHKFCWSFYELNIFHCHLICTLNGQRCTLQQLRRQLQNCESSFVAYRLLEQLISDNGPQLVSDEFATFMKMNGIKHIFRAPYHPSSNSATERFVRIFKKEIKASQDSPLSFIH